MPMINDNISYSFSKVAQPGTSLVVQWLRLRAPNAGGLGSGQGTRSRMLQLKKRSRTPQQRSHMWQQRSLVLQLRPGAAK